MAKVRLMPEEKETIMLTSEADDHYEIFTFNTELKRKLARFSSRYPESCKIIRNDPDIGYATYLIRKDRISLQLRPPYSESRKEAASEHGKRMAATLNKKS